MHLVLLKRRKRKMIGLCMLLVNLLLNHLRIQMISLFLMQTQSGNEHGPNENANDDAQPASSNDNDVEVEPAVDLDNPQSKNQHYDKRDFVARKHGKEREPWVQKPMPFPPKPSKKKDNEDFERFAEMIRPIFLRMRLTDMFKVNPYAKYMKDIV